MRRSKVLALAFTLCLCAGGSAFGAEAGWVNQPGGWLYQDENGDAVKNNWREIDGKWYHFDEVGMMNTGWFEDGANWYYFEEDGSMAVNCLKELDGQSYVFDKDGIWRENGSLEAEKTDAEIQLDQMADQLLAGIVNDGMSQREKAAAIYRWVRSNMRYVNHSEKDDWVKAATDGLRRKSGDCFTYYAISREFLNRVGIENLQVTRLDGHHFWNLAHMEDGWYHFDTTPRTAGGEFCLLTDAQLEAYSAAHNGTHRFDRSLYPATP